MELRVIYKSRPQAVSRIVNLLRDEGFSPTVLDHPDTTYAYASKGTHLIRIAVPPTEAPPARSCLARWEKSARPSVDKLSYKLSTQFVHSILITALFGAFLLALGYPLGTFLPWLFLVWIPVFVVIANVQRILKK